MTSGAGTPSGFDSLVIASDELLTVQPPDVHACEYHTRRNYCVL